jgi:hypothetical protein
VDSDQRIIQKPFTLMMAAQHLAAIKIQGAIRRFLYNKRRKTGLLIPFYQRKRLQQEKKVLQLQATLMAEAFNFNMEYATPEQQAQYQKLMHQLSQLNYMEAQFNQQYRSVFGTKARVADFRGSENAGHLSASQSLRQKFLTSPFNLPHLHEDQCLRNFCAALIQATYKMSLCRRLFKFHRFAMYHIAACLIQWGWMGFKDRRKKRELKSKDQVAAEKIQRAWRSFTNVRIYRYYRDLINFRNKGDPFELLKCINPGEAALIDPASRCHVRFRLGGFKFPPIIYYKIFVAGGVVDINAFAPRNYGQIKKQKRKDVLNMHFDRDPADGHQGWYERFENNGWRPINDKMLTPNDQVEEATKQKSRPFHFDVQKRRALTQKEKRLKKIKWLRKLYRDAKNAEILQDKYGENTNIQINNKMAAELEKLYDNPFDDQALPDLEKPDFDSEVNNLIEWCEDLDFEKYVESWQTVATSDKLVHLPQEPFKILGTELGGFTFEVNSQIQALQEEMDAEGLGAQKVTQEMIDEQLKQIQEEHPEIPETHLARREKEEMFIKSNLDYENRLKSHMYQFDDPLTQEQSAKNLNISAQVSVSNN